MIVGDSYGDSSLAKKNKMNPSGCNILPTSNKAFGKNSPTIYYHV